MVKNPLIVQSQTPSFRPERKGGGRCPRCFPIVSAQASFAKGVLEVRIPKPEQRKARKVAINVTSGAGEPSTIEGSEAGGSGPDAS